MQKSLIIILLFLISCGKKDAAEQKPNILLMKEMSELATVEYTVTKIIKVSDNSAWYKIGDRRILMSCKAHIKAGIDMSEISERNFSIAEKNIEVNLPLPKIISISIPPEDIKTEYEEIGAFRDKFKTRDRDALAVQAENQIRKSVDSLGILNQAKVNTSLFVTTFLQKLGYENIRINYNGMPLNITQ